MTPSLLLSLAMLAPVSESGAPHRPQVEVRASLEDDALAGDTTQGRAYGTHLHLQAMGTPGRSFQERALGRGPLAGGALRFGTVVGLSASIPSDPTRADVDRDDRPYSGYTYAGFIVELSDGVRNRLRAQLRYGAIGPWSGAGRFHRAWTRALGATAPRGWDHQIRNELHFDLGADWDRELARFGGARGVHWADVLTHGRVELAEYAVAGSAGATLRIGRLLRPFVGVPDRRADARRHGCSTGRCRVAAGLQAYVYVRADAGVVLRRTTVDGSLFDRGTDADRSVHRSDSRPFVPRGEVGVVLQPTHAIDLRFGLHHVGAEVEAPGAKGHTTGQVSVGVRF